MFNYSSEYIYIDSLASFLGKCRKNILDFFQFNNISLKIEFIFKNYV